MLSQTVRKWWGPLDGVQNYVADSIPQGARVLEIGPGIAPFRRATHLFDREFYWDVLPEGILRENIYTGDAEGSLPFPDKYFDFVYCRHVVEDLNNPFTLLKEMSRIGKAGYVETPSVMELRYSTDVGFRLIYSKSIRPSHIKYVFQYS